MAQDINPTLLDELFAEAVFVFTEHEPDSVDEDTAHWLEEVVGKAIVFAEQHNVPLQPGIIEENADAILAMPDLVDTDPAFAEAAAGIPTGLASIVNALKNDTNRALRWILVMLGFLFLGILFEKFTKVIAIVGLVVVFVLLFWHYKSAAEDSLNKTPLPVPVPKPTPSSTAQSQTT